MLQRIKMSIIALVAMALPIAAPVSVAAVGNSEAACQGASLEAPDGTTGNCVDAAAGTSVTGLIKQIINIFTWVVGVVAVIMIIIAGFRYVVSGGDSGGVSGAKNTILYAIVGLIIVIMAQVIVRFVLTNVG